ncbi:MAG: CoB--CoM heterodisulfide reductase iron-sulfur subunit B family protein [Bacteroidaceae bacterium]|jgi:heterodisulfide reductase subunit B
MKEIGFYPGCSLEGTSREYNESVQALARHFSLPLKEIEDWNCCGASAAHALNHDLALALPARILALAEAQGMEEVVVPCAACFGRLATTQYKLAHDEELRKHICNIIQMPYQGKLKILNVLQWTEQYIKPLLTQVPHPLQKKVACYYGCLLIRPHKILQFDRVENPQSMDELARLCGSEPIDWAFKTECCGAGLSISRTESVGRLSGDILSDASDRGAEAVIVACPMCHSNLDMRRPAANRYLGKELDLPVLFITQLIGLSLGISRKELGLDRHFVPVPEW